MPSFVEWMMGFPEGWVGGVSRTQALKMLGNAVVPKQAALAWSLLAAHLIPERDPGNQKNGAVICDAWPSPSF